MATAPDEARPDDRHGPGGQVGGDPTAGGQVGGEEPERHTRWRLPGLRRQRAVPDPEPLSAEPAATSRATTEASETSTTDTSDTSVPAEAGAPPSPPASGSERRPESDHSIASPAERILARRERRRRRANRRRWSVTVPALLAVLVVLAIVGAQLRGDATAPAATAPRAAPAPLARNVPTLLVAHVAGDGRIDLAALVGLTRDGRNGSILLVPTLTQAETPSLDFQVLADLRSLGSTSLLQTTVENLLGVRVDATQIFDDARLTGAITAAGPLTVDLNGDAEVGSGDQTRVFPSGNQRITPADAVALLTQRPSTDEIDHMVTVQAVFEGWLEALRTQAGTAATSRRVPTLAPLVAAAHTSTHFSVVPVDAISSGPGERYQVRTDALASAMQEAFPDAQLGVDGRRLRTEILNGTGVPGLVPQVARVVVPAGAQVVTTGNMPGFGQATTQVVYYRDADRAAADRLLTVLGAGKLVKEPNDIQVFDVTIIVGADFSPARAR
jgi:hypothetical protein